jgi:tripartite ATP-independent transporter DctM subunit
VLGAAALMLFLEAPAGAWSDPAIDVFGGKLAENAALPAIPLFALAGSVLIHSGTPKRIARLSRAWFGWMPGGPAIAALLAVVALAPFAGATASAVVCALLLGRDRTKEGAPSCPGLELVTAGASVGGVFPPSLALLLYGCVASLVMPQAFVAGILPGLLALCALAACGALLGARGSAERGSFQLSEALACLRESAWELAIPVLLVAPIAAGLLRVHEAAAGAALYALVIALFVRRDLNAAADLPRVITHAASTIGAVLVLLATAIGLHAWLVQAGVPLELWSWVDAVLGSQFPFLLAVAAVLVVTGAVVDAFTGIVVVVPLILPSAQAYRVDAYHLAVIALFALGIGQVVRPFVFGPASPDRAARPSGPTLRWLVGSLTVVLLVVIGAPALSSWLPHRIPADAGAATARDVAPAARE